MRFNLTAAFGALLMLSGQPAFADVCDTGGAQVLACGLSRGAEVEWDLFAQLGGLFSGDEYPGCGVGSDYGNPEEAWVFTCAASGRVAVTIDQMACNLDMFLLDGNCNPSDPASCQGASVRGGQQPDVIEFECTAGAVYFVVIERVEADLVPSWVPWVGSECSIWDDHPFHIRVECFEECEDGVDNDGDGKIDCFDEECPVCFEDCHDGKDNDLDNLVDCADPDCATDAECCDRDRDGYFYKAGICGGDDCNDDPLAGGAYVHPGSGEIPADLIDQNCDGWEDCYRDADGDFYGVPTIEPSRTFSCQSPGVANNDDDCNDTDATINPGKPEIIANGKDDDCDGYEICYLDEDIDRWGGPDTVETSVTDCSASRYSVRTGDCNDNDPSMYPGAPEITADGKDEDCNGLETCYTDQDNDAYGVTTTIETAITTCVGAGISIRSDDCDDRPGVGYPIHPNAAEIKADGIDEDCDGYEECWVDADFDLHGNDGGSFIPSVPLSCTAAGVSPLADDCDDANPAIHPGASDPPGDGIDQDCDALQDCYRDLDGDGWGGSTIIASTIGSCVGTGISPRTGDCDDSDNSVYPTAVENPNNGVDQDCDGFEDCYQDLDHDTFGSSLITESSTLSCVAPGVANNYQDCNDVPPLGAAIHPGAAEIPRNGIDENCDGYEFCYQDYDNDGYGRSTLVPSTVLSCAAAGVSTNDLDCDDTAQGFQVHPGATETPADNRDQDCDGKEDCYLDNDLDHFGVPLIVESTSMLCVASGVANRDDDCNDNDPLVYPGAPTGPLGGVDYDCSGFTTCYQDADFDGYGSSIQVPSGDPMCSVPGQSLNNLDCNDADQQVHPGVTDTPLDYKDNDCDGYEMCYQDLDLDGYGTVTLQPSTALNCVAPGVSRTADDCNDSPALHGADIHPGATEIPASDWDENCDGFELCYRDQDADGYGHPTVTVQTTDLTCQAGFGYSDNNLDCRDDNSAINPGATDIPANRVDENCDGVDNCYQDLDADTFGSRVVIPGYDMTCTGVGVSPLGTDCYDIPPDGALVHPGATEIPGSGIDENCDTLEICFRDVDMDGYGGTLQQTSPNLLCNSFGLSRTNDDCNDTAAPGIGPSIHPGAAEVPADGIDQDCDTKEDCYQDLDDDQYGTAVIVESASLVCYADGVAPNDDDCYDLPPTGSTIHPGAQEVVGDGVDQNCDGVETCYRDIDGDSYGRNTPVSSPIVTCTGSGFSTRNDDCNDSSGTGFPIHPDAVEIPVDGVDQDCNGTEQCYQDKDGDNFGVPSIVESSDWTCSIASGVSVWNTDCNDIMPTGPFVYPGAPEVPGDGIDQDCDGEEICFLDQDGDGFGGTATTSTPSFSCTAPGATMVGGDCDDGNRFINPGAPEIPGDDVDQDCDSVDDCYQDIDRDLYGSTVIIPGLDTTCDEAGVARDGGDCVDVGTLLGVRASAINPAADEVCNEVDDDCDGDIDDEDASLLSQYVWYLDADGDGFGRDTVFRAACDQPDGYVGDDGDCDDDDAAINPDAQEICDPFGIDEDCDGGANEDDPDALGLGTWHPDSDGDGYGDDDPSLAEVDCFPDPGMVLDDTDCNDQSALVHPGQLEIPYDGLDNDCDPTTLDDDLDNDGYGHLVDCNDVPVVGHDINPGASEGVIGDGVDDDCDGKVDDGTDRYDDDGDGWTELGGDCNDALASVHPSAVEQADAIDQDCDGIVDEGTDRYDDDGDGFTENQGDCADADARMHPGQPEIPDNGIDDDCNGSVDGGTGDPDEDGYTPLGGDCDDNDGTTYPHAPELADGVDNDCDGITDEGTTLSDDDSDGYTEVTGDCNDAVATIHPAATEIANGVDDDCDGVIDNDSSNSDDDGDGFAENQGDCDDTNPAIFPGAEELDNDVDDDCDGRIDENTLDIDADGYTTDAGDCDDLEGWANPGQDELCDGIDNDCDGQVDNGVGVDCQGGVNPPPEPKTETCGCSTSGSPMTALAFVLAMLAGRRRAPPRRRVG